jgi:ribosome-associated toxin RatA of RatAB toxin-antitoxin module
VAGSLVAAVVAIALTMHAPAAAADLTVRVLQPKDGVVIEANAVLRADVATAWSVLTDYDRYDRFVPGLRSSRVLERRGVNVTVRQLSEASIGIFRTPMTITYEIVEDAPTEVRSRVVAGCDCALESVYVLTPLDGNVRLAYTGRFGAPADMRAALEVSAGEQQITRYLRALADEIERKAAAQDATRDEALAPSVERQR